MLAKAPNKAPKKPTKPALWASLKKRARASSAGSKPGQWSALKAVLTQREYRKQGGGWKTT